MVSPQNRGGQISLGRDLERDRKGGMKTPVSSNGRWWAGWCGFLALGILAGAEPRGGEAGTRAGEVRVEEPTLECLGFVWEVEGDANRNGTVRVFWREAGRAQEAEREGMPFLRVGGERAGAPEWGFTTPSYWGGSILGLNPGTEYLCRLELQDPDGVEGEAVRELRVRTRSEPPEAPAGGRVRHVYPQDWQGPKEEPAYRGLLHAYYGYPRYADWILTTDPAQPGDTLIVHAGVYRADFKDYRDYHGLTFDGTYTLTQDGTAQRPIVIRAAGDGEVVFDGNGCAVLFDLTAADYHRLEGLTLQNAEVALRAGVMNASGCQGLVVRECTLRDIGIGIQAQWEESKGFLITDNTFSGREARDRVYHHRGEGGKKVQRIASYYAVKVHGQGHVVRHNRVEYFFDGIDLCTHARPETDPRKQAAAIDIHGNDIFLCNDNFIEADGGNSNIRIWENRCFNSGQQALSNQPVLGGPVYWIRNVVYHCGDAATFKFWGMYPAGILAYHNTSTGILTRPDKPGSNVHFRNNLFLPGDDATQPTLGLYSFSGYSTLDYNGYRRREPFIAYLAPAGVADYDSEEGKEARSHASLAEFSRSTGQEAHGREVDYDIFAGAEAPGWLAWRQEQGEAEGVFPVFYSATVDLRLRKGSAAVDAGCRIPGVNEDFRGSAPDLGAYELGAPLPGYGPRPRPREDKPEKPGRRALSREEEAAGWRLLFDGETLEGWRGYNMAGRPRNWQAAGGELRADGSKGDLVTAEEWTDFELELEWKVSTGGNSGVFFHVRERPDLAEVWRTGLEMQVMDNAGNPMGRDPLRSAGSLFALYPARSDQARPAGEWNRARVVSRGAEVEYWLNGERVNAFTRWTPQWYSDREKTLHHSGRKPLWGEFGRGRIALQDEGFAVAYRNIRIRPLETPRRPNIVVLLADDLGWRDLGVTGSRYYETPHLDRMAAEGLRFTQAYAAAPVCAPTRAALMTGKAPARLNLTAVFDRDGGREALLPPVWDSELALEEVTLAERLRRLGYRTALMGKWHLGRGPERWPEAQGFDVNLGGCDLGRPPRYFSPYGNPRLADGPEGEYLTDRLAEEAAAFIRAQEPEVPFYLQLSFYSPHAPLEAPEGEIDRFRTKARDGGQKEPVYAAMIARMDAAVGRVLASLEEAGVAPSTLVVFTSDNGGVRTLGTLEITDNAPLRGEKFQLYEGGIRVPLIVRWPGVAPRGETTGQLTSTEDLLPTLMAAAGAPLGEEEADGRNLLPVWKEGERVRWERDLAWHYPHYMPRQDMRPASAYRSGPYKLIYHYEEARLELFDLPADPGETANLAGERPELALELYGKLEDWLRRTGARRPRPNPGGAPARALEAAGKEEGGAGSRPGNTPMGEGIAPVQ